MKIAVIDDERPARKMLIRRVKEVLPACEITDMIEAAMEHHKKIAHPSLDEVLDAEAETYEFLKKQWNF